MAELNVTTMSSKGQIVIPMEMRKEFKEGEKFVIIKAGKKFILKTLSAFDKNIKEDLEFARRTEEAWKRYHKGEFESKSADEFFSELEQC